MKKKFPTSFLWGAATAAYQVEGGINNDWEVYMSLHAKEKAQNAEVEYKDQVGMLGRFDEKIWAQFKDQAIKPENYVSGKASNMYETFEKDINLMKKLNLNSYRFSIEWARIEPEEGQFDQKAMDVYVNWIRLLKDNNIEPIVTLWHFTNPVWFAKKGGWATKESVELFKRYVEFVGSNLKAHAKYIVTLNEPSVYVAGAYLSGDWPPAKQIGWRVIGVLNTMIEAHKKAYTSLKQIDSNFRISIAKHSTDIQIHRGAFLLYPFIRYYDYLFNDKFVDDSIGYLDYLGLNYYNKIDVTFSRILKAIYIFVFRKFDTEINSLKNQSNDVMGISDMGWNLYPKGLYRRVNHYWNKHKLPILITEHGLADANDRMRKEYTKKSLEYLHKNIQEGVGVLGYMHWSFIDNFEWDKGFWPRFGLVHVDYGTQKRTIRESAKWYAQVAKTGEV